MSKTINTPARKRATEKYRQRKREAGLCIGGGCSNPAKHQRLRCEECALMSSQQARIRAYGTEAIQHMALQIGVQQNLCAICGKVLTKPQQDHNHTTDQLRGVLCIPCNGWLGVVESFPTLLEKVLTYKDKWDSIKKVEAMTYGKTES